MTWNVRRFRKEVTTLSLRDQPGAVQIEESPWTILMKDLTVVNPVIRKILKYIDKEFHPEMTVSCIAQAIGYCPRHAQRLCRLEIGHSLSDLIRMKRMDIAHRLLKEEKWKVKEICSLVGYKNPSRFAAAFRQTFGYNPSEYLRNI